jgi:hypothetical protein
MEDQKLRTGRQNMRQSGMPLLRRRAVMLPTVLVIILLVSLILVGVFEFAISTKNLTTVRGERYADQMLVFGYIEETKGKLIHKMKDTGEAIHPGGVAAWKLRPSLASVSGLRVGDEIGVNREVTDGGRKLRVNVFDLTYDTGQVESSITNDPNELRVLPPPLVLTAGQMGSRDGVINAGSTDGATDIRDSGDGTLGGAVDLRYFGAYLIRVEVFTSPDLPFHDARRVRLTEEAFLQVLSKDS